MMIKTPQWLKNRAGEIEEAPMPLPPPIALVVPPARQQPVEISEDVKFEVLTKAHNIVEQIKAERLALKNEIAKLQGEMAELILLLESEKKKVGIIELDLATAANNAQTLQTQVTEYRQLLSLQRQLMDRWEIKAPVRTKPRQKKTTEAKANDHG